VDWQQLSSKIRSSPGEALTLVIDRGGEQLTLTATPQLTQNFAVNDGEYVLDADGERIVENVGMLGFTSQFQRQAQPVTTVLPAVGDGIANVTHMILNLPQRLIDVWNAAFGADERDPDGPISVVGVGRIAGEVTTIDTIPVVDR